MFATNGRFYTIEAAKLPGGRGHGEPVRQFADMEQEADIVTMFPFQGGRKFIVASHQGRGFIVAEEECLGTTRKGKQVLNVKAPDEARAVATVEGEQVAAIGDNRKMLIFPLEQLPEMARGSGVRLQRYKDGGLSDVKTFKGADGLTWTDGAGREFSLTLKELSDWRGNRADAGRLPPKGFPRSQQVQVAACAIAASATAIADGAAMAAQASMLIAASIGAGGLIVSQLLLPPGWIFKALARRRLERARRPCSIATEQPTLYWFIDRLCVVASFWVWVWLPAPFSCTRARCPDARSEHERRASVFRNLLSCVDMLPVMFRWSFIGAISAIANYSQLAIVRAEEGPAPSCWRRRDGG